MQIGIMDYIFLSILILWLGYTVGVLIYAAILEIFYCDDDGDEEEEDLVDMVYDWLTEERKPGKTEFSFTFLGFSYKRK